KLDNLTLGYTFNPQLIKGISNLRIYVSGLNLVTFTKYKGLDPEATSYEGEFQFAPGIEHRDRYPTPRTYTIGLNVKFYSYHESHSDFAALKLNENEEFKIKKHIATQWVIRFDHDIQCLYRFK